MENFAELCAGNFTGADFYALCSNALAVAIKRNALRIRDLVDGINEMNCYDDTQLTVRGWFAEASAEQLDVEVTMEDFLAARSTIVPSVSSSELAHYESLREQFSPSSSS